jgi:hypothetical protein
MLRLLAASVAIGGALVCCASTASAQPIMDSPPATQTDFHKMRVRVGDRLYVSDPDRGVEVSGRVTSLSDGELTIDGYRFTPKPGLKIERQGDTIWGGAALGFLLGGFGGTTIGAEGCLGRSMAPCFLSGGVIYGALGAYIDWRHAGRTAVFLGGPAAKGPLDPELRGKPADVPAAVAFDFSALGLKVGDRVAVTAAGGTQTTGPISVMTRHAFRVGAVDLTQVSPVQVERIGDPVWNGAAYGAGFSVMMSVAARTTVKGAAMSAVVFGGIGALIDFGITGRATVYGGADPLGRSSSLRLVPEIGPHSKGAALVVQF